MKVQYAMISRFTVRLLSDILAAKRLPAYDNLRITNERPPTPPLIAAFSFLLSFIIPVEMKMKYRYR